MPDDNNALSEELKKKRIAGIERRKQEDAAWKAREEKPGYKLITRGPRKGQLVRMTYREKRDDQRAKEAERFKRESQKKAELLNSDTGIPEVSSKQPNAQPKYSFEVVWWFLVACALSIASLYIAKMFVALKMFFPALAIDIIAFWIFRPKRRYRMRYLPFLWWL